MSTTFAEFLAQRPVVHRGGLDGPITVHVSPNKPNRKSSLKDDDDSYMCLVDADGGEHRLSKRAAKSAALLRR